MVQYCEKCGKYMAEQSLTCPVCDKCILTEVTYSYSGVEENYDYNIDNLKNERYFIKRLYIALQLSCDIIKSGDIEVSDETRPVLRSIINGDLEGYFISEADKLMDE